MKEPEDFDAFRDQVKKELDAVPMKVLEKVKIPEEKRVDVCDVSFHGAGSAVPVKQSFYDGLRKNYYHTALDRFRPTRYAHWNKHDRDKFYFKGGEAGFSIFSGFGRDGAFRSGLSEQLK